MKLSKPTARKPIHKRQIKCTGYSRDDGNWDIEGHLVDTKSYTFCNQWRGSITPGIPLHEMSVRLTVDNDLVVIDIEVATKYSPYPECPSFPDNAHKLKGLKIAPGWNNALRKKLGGTNGCTHINELLGRIANVAFQTIMPIINKNVVNTNETKKPYILDTCHALSIRGNVVLREWPQFYTGDL